MMINKIIVIYNEYSGSFNKKKIDNFVKKLIERNYEVVVFRGNTEFEIKHILDNSNFEEKTLVIFASGDGTINFAINYLHNHKYLQNIVIAVLPMGTANVLSIELNTTNIKKLENAIDNGEIMQMHIGKITEINTNNVRYFSLMSSIGFDSEAIEHIKYYKKFIIGKLSYIIAYLFYFAFGKKHDFVTKIDNVEYENSFTCISNGKFYGIKQAFTTSNISENNFDIVIAKKLIFFSFIKYFFTKKNNKNILLIKAKEVFVKNVNEKDKIGFQLDGDYLVQTPAKIETTDYFVNVLKNK